MPRLSALVFLFYSLSYPWEASVESIDVDEPAVSRGSPHLDTPHLRSLLLTEPLSLSQEQSVPPRNLPSLSKQVQSAHQWLKTTPAPQITQSLFWKFQVRMGYSEFGPPVTISLGTPRVRLYPALCLLFVARFPEMLTMVGGTANFLSACLETRPPHPAHQHEPNSQKQGRRCWSWLSSFLPQICFGAGKTRILGTVMQP